MLELSDLGEGRTPAITSAVGNMLAEAAGVCLEAEGHAPGVHLLVRGYLDASYSLLWPLITVQALRTWNNRERATEFGAEGIALLLAEQELGYAVIECSRRGTGFDYWMGIKSRRYVPTQSAAGSIRYPSRRRPRRQDTSVAEVAANRPL